MHIFAIRRTQMMYERISEKELIASLIAGNENAFQTVFKRHYGVLLRFAVSYTGANNIAEDIVQESFVLLWEKRNELEENTNPYAFLIKVVKLKMWNYLDKQRRRTVIEKGMYDNLVRELDLNLYTLDSINISALYISEIEHIVRDTLLTLPEQTQVIFKLSREEYLSNKEIAERMNVSEKSIEYHIGKAIKVLRTELIDYIKILIIITGGI